MASICKRQSGWQAQIRKRGYTPVSKRFDKRADAEAWARQIESEIDKGVFVDRTEAQRTTLGEVLLRYKAEVTVTKRGFVQENSRISCLLRHPLSKRTLPALRSSGFAAYRDERLLEVCGTTVNKELNLFARAIDTASIDWSIHVENPVRLVRRPRSNPGRTRRLLAGEERRLIAATESPMLAYAIVIALETAMRRGEISNARWEHLNLRDRVLQVPATKTDSPRDVPLTTRAVDTFRTIPRRIDGMVFGTRPHCAVMRPASICATRQNTPRKGALAKPPT